MMDIKLKLFIRNYNGGPGVRISWGEQTLFDQILAKKGLNEISLNVNKFALPNSLIIEMYNKDMRHDTLLDDNKNIIDDKACYIAEVCFGDIALTQELFLFNFKKESGDVSSNNVYMGFNGKFTVDITSDNLHEWYHGLQKHLLTNIEKFDYEQFKTEIFGINKINYSIKY